MNAVDLATGEPAWESPVPLEDVVQTPVAVDETSAYVGDVGGRVTAIDLATGDVRWAEELGTPISGAVTLDAGRALVTTLGGRDEPSEVVALDAETGEDLWRASAEDASNLVSAPVVADGRVLVLDASAGSSRSTPRTAASSGDRRSSTRSPRAVSRSSSRAWGRRRRSRRTVRCSPST